jgi:hypothetical protein
MGSNMSNEHATEKNVNSSDNSALEILTKKMLKEIKKTKSSSNESLNVNELKKTIKDLIENSELNNENN